MIGIIAIATIVGYVVIPILPIFILEEILNNPVEGIESIQKTTTAKETNTESIIRENDKMLQFTKAPEFQKIDDAININNNNTPVTMASLEGKVVLVNFWTYSCINVLRTLPYLLEWDTKYSEDGLVIIGIHTPEFEFEKNIDNVRAATQKYNIKYPVLQDNAYGTWKAYENNYWPRMYLIDSDGYIRYDKIGEGGYGNTEKLIQSLLHERNIQKDVKNIDYNNKTFSNDNDNNSSSKIQDNPNNKISNFLSQPVDFTKIKTPELYFGKSSRSAIGNPEGFHSGQTVNYTGQSLSPSSNTSLKPNTIYLEGQWKNNKDNVELQSDNGSIFLKYNAKSVNLVAGINNSFTNQSLATVLVDNSLDSNSSKGIDIGNNHEIILDYPRMYNIVNHQSYNGTHSLLIDIKGKGFQAYAFTFG